MNPLVAGLILVVHTQEGLMLHYTELVLDPHRDRIRRDGVPGADAVRSGNGIAALDKRERGDLWGRGIDNGAARKGVLRVARVGVTEARIDADRRGDLEVRLQIESLRHGIPQIVGPLDLADGGHDFARVLLPLDVVAAAGEANDAP